MTVIRSVLKLLSRSEKRSALAVCGLVMLSAIFDALSVLSVLPFLSTVSDPGAVTEGGYLTQAYDFVGTDNVREFIVLLGFGSFAMIVSAAAVRTLGQYYISRFVQLRRHSIATRLLEVYLCQPYEFFITRNSSDLAKEILSEVDTVIVSAVQPIAEIISATVSLTVLILLLIALDPVVALTAGAVLAAVYLTVFRALKPIVVAAGSKRTTANKSRFEALSEALDGIKMIKLYGNEEVYLDRFSHPSRKMSEAITTSTVVGRIPKYLIEAVAMGGIILLSLVLYLRQTADGGSTATLLPMLGLYGLCGYRMLPAIQMIYLSVTQIRFGVEPLRNISSETANAGSGIKALPRAARDGGALTFETAVQFEEVFYRYPGNRAHGIHDMTLTIPSGQSIGIVGETGAGKTTFIDLFLGLLVPSQGRILCDGVELTSTNMPAFRAKVGYVPQEIMLTNGSIKSNIAFGVAGGEVDMDRVIECAQVAQIHDFVLSDLPDGYDTAVGERGIRLSGGQRQRIGIARALYSDPSVLVLDEATSALDTTTEANVMAGILKMGQSKTVVTVAHRHSTLESCDQVVVLKSGRIARIGDPATILDGSIKLQGAPKPTPDGSAAQ